MGKFSQARLVSFYQTLVLQTHAAVENQPINAYGRLPFMVKYLVSRWVIKSRRFIDKKKRDSYTYLWARPVWVADWILLP